MRGKITRIYTTTAAKQHITKTKDDSLRFYKTIDDIPLYNFLKCLCDGDFSYLYKERNTLSNTENNSEIMGIWEDLLIQYNEVNTGKDFAFEDIKKLYSIMSCVRILESAYGLIGEVPGNINKILRKTGVRLTENNDSNTLIISGKIEKLLREYNALIEKTENKKDNKKPEIQHYIDLLAVMSLHFKFNLDVHCISVATFCSYYSLFNKEIESLKKMKVRGR